MPQTHYPAPMYHTARPFGKACRFFAYKASKGPVLFFYTTLFQNTPPHFVATPGGFKCLVILYIGERANRPHFSDPLPSSLDQTKAYPPPATHPAPRGQPGTLPHPLPVHCLPILSASHGLPRRYTFCIRPSPRLHPKPPHFSVLNLV